MKKCINCKKLKQSKDFYKTSKSWCKKCYIKRVRQWIINNPEKHKKYSKRWKRKNPEKNRKINQQWMKNNPKRHQECVRRYKARKAGNKGKVTKEEYNTLPNFCVFCFSVENLTIEHILPLDRQGWHVIENITTLCKFCNSSKQNKLLSEWLTDEATTIEFWYYNRSIK